MPYEFIARQFFQFDRWTDARPIGHGNINDTFRMDFETGGVAQRFLLQRLNHHIFKDPEALMENIERVCDYLLEKDYPYQVVAPLRSRKGQLLHRDEGGNCWRVFPWVENSYAPEGRVGPAIALEAARAYGAFSSALRHFPAHTLAETIPGFHDSERRWAVFEQVIQNDPAGRVRASAAEIKAMQEAFPLFQQISRMKKSGELPLRVTHNDTKAGNVLFDQNTHTALAVIDLDTVMPGTILSDFGDMVRTFAPDRSEDGSLPISVQRDMIEALQTGFLSQTADWLSATERAHLMTGALWIIAEQALRFLTDWLAGDVYYKIRHPEHNLLRARNQLALLEALGLERQKQRS